MIKQKFILLALLFYGFVMQSQTIYWEENFDTPPPDWTLDENWVFQEETLMFRWYPPTTNYDISAVSPEISLPSEATILSIYQYLGVNSVLVTNEEAEISIISNGEETTVWQHLCSDGNWGAQGGQELSFLVSDYAGENIQIKFRSYGSSTDVWNFWFVYEMNLKALFSNDLEVVSISGDNNIGLDEVGNWNVYVKNVGNTSQNNFSVNILCNKTGELLSSVDYSDVLESGNTADIALNWSPGEPYNTTIVGQIDSDVDEFEGNNSSAPHFLRIKPNEQFDVLVLDLDNDIATIENPETNELEQPNESIERALTTAGIEFDYDNRVPADISAYEMVILTLGSFCLG